MTGVGQPIKTRKWDKIHEIVGFSVKKLVIIKILKIKAIESPKKWDIVIKKWKSTLLGIKSGTVDGYGVGWYMHDHIWAFLINSHWNNVGEAPTLRILITAILDGGRTPTSLLHP